MNSEERAALVEELTQAQHDAWPGVDADFIVNTEAIMPIIDRILTTRAELVDWRNDDDLRKLRESILIDVDNAYRHGLADSYGFEATRYADRIMLEIARIITTRAIPVPDDEQVERAIRAFNRAGEGDTYATELFEGFDDSPDALADKRQMRAALKAAGSDADWLDEALDSVHPECEIGHVFLRADRTGAAAQVAWPLADPKDVTTWVEHKPWNRANGTGANRREAIMNAIAAAQKGDQP